MLAIQIALEVLLAITSLLLTLLILLHKGRGGGLSDMFGGGLTSSVASSGVAERNLNRITIILGLVWLAVIVTLGLFTRFSRDIGLHLILSRSMGGAGRSRPPPGSSPGGAAAAGNSLMHETLTKLHVHLHLFRLPHHPRVTAAARAPSVVTAPPGSWHTDRPCACRRTRP